MNKNYASLKQELEKMIALLEDDSLDIDEAVTIFEKSQKIMAEMDAYLKKTEAKIVKITNK